MKRESWNFRDGKKLFAEVFERAELVSIVLVDNWKVFVCNSDFLLRVFVSNQCFAERDFDVRIRSYHRPKECQCLELEAIVRAAIERKRKQTIRN